MVGLARHEAGEGGADLGGLQGSGVDAELHRHGTHHAGDFFVFDAERGFAGVDGDDDAAEGVALDLSWGSLDGFVGRVQGGSGDSG